MRIIKIYSDTTKGCIFFDGSTVEPKFLGTIQAIPHPTAPGRIIVYRLDRLRSDGVSFRVIFRRLKFERVSNRDGENLHSDLGYTRQQVVDYINEQASAFQTVSSTRPAIGETIGFKLDATSTTILVNNGESFGINTLKATLTEGGLIQITSTDFSNNSVVYYDEIDPSIVEVNDAAVAGGPQDIVNVLNELFTAGPFEAVVISDPYSTMIADVDGEFAGYTLEGSAAVDPEGNDIFTATGSTNYAGLKSVATIDQAGEYFTFDIRGEGQIGFGLVHSDASYAAGHYSGNASYADPSTFAVGNSAHYGFQFSHWFHPTPNGSWTNYGANTLYSIRPGWSNWDQKQDWIDGNPVKIRVGIDTNGFISVESLQNDSTWVVHARTTYPVPDGGEYHLGIKAANSSPRVFSAPKVHLLEPEAPTLYARIIESPDGVFQYPLFATEDEANYYDSKSGGSGTGSSHQHVFADDPTGTTWYMPDNGGTMAGTSSVVGELFEGQFLTYTEITSLTNADLTPPVFVAFPLVAYEGVAVNYQTQPMDTNYVTTITNLPAGLVDMGGGMIGGTPAPVPGTTINDYERTNIVVTRTNSYGSSVGGMTIDVYNTDVPVTPVAGFSHVSGSNPLVDSDTLDAGSAVTIDNVVDDGNRFIINKEWLDGTVLPAITAGTGAKQVFIGFGASGADWSTGPTGADYDLAYGFYADDTSRAQNNWKLRIYKSGVQVNNIGVGGQTSGLYDYVLMNEGTEIRVASLVESQGHSASSYVWDATDTNWKYPQVLTGQSAGNKTITIATNGVQLDLDGGEFSEVTEPAAPVVTNDTPWTKALDFSGSSERAQQVTNNPNYIPLAMDGLSATASANSDTSKTSGHIYSRPWATAVVFKLDLNASNQHIWNFGEGSSGDNIYLRVDAQRQLYFGWGRDGSLNELRFTADIGTGNWYGVYIAHKGARYNSSNATAANLADAFDIRLAGSHNSWTMSSNLSTSSNWSTLATSTGGRMDRQVSNYLTLGGRGANRSFHGKIASFVTTTLRINQAMPSDAEVLTMVTDPVKWLNDYKVGNQYRVAYGQSEATFSLVNYLTWAAGSTQVWLMGDGTNDSYSNMIRNQVYPAGQNYGKLNLISMVSNDIQNVTIPGLT